MLAIRRYLPKAIRCIGRVITLLGVVLFIIFLVIALLVQDPASKGIYETILLSAIILFALSGFVVSWRRDEFAGILLVFAYAGLVIVSVFAYGLRDSLDWAKAGLPLLLGGLLFITSSWLSGNLSLLRSLAVWKRLARLH